MVSPPLHVRAVHEHTVLIRPYPGPRCWHVLGSCCFQDQSEWQIGSSALGAGYRVSPLTAATRRAFAAMVSAGLSAVEEGKQALSTTHRLSTSWARQVGSSTLRRGSAPMTAVPH